MKRTSMNKRQTGTAPSDTRFVRPTFGGRQTQPTLRPTPQANYEQYLALAKAKALAGDQIEAERYYQYAEHYHRLLKGTAA